MPKRIDGGNAIYHYLQKIVIPRDDAFSRELVLRLVLDLSIWLPLELYCAVPLLLPYCRARFFDPQEGMGLGQPAGLPARQQFDPQAAGERLCHSTARASRPTTALGAGATLPPAMPGAGCGWMASARWPPRTRWPTPLCPTWPGCPAQIAKLTDHEGSFAQQVLQAVAWAYYAPAPLAHPPALAGIWDGLQPPDLQLDLDPAQLNTFVVTPALRSKSGAATWSRRSKPSDNSRARAAPPWEIPAQFPLPAVAERHPARTGRRHAGLAAELPRISGRLRLISRSRLHSILPRSPTTMTPSAQPARRS